MKRLEGRVLDLLALLEDDEAICEAINRGYVVSQGGITSTHKGRAALVTARAIKQWFDDGAKPPNPEPMRIEFYDPMWKRGRSAEVSTIEARVVALAQVDDEAFALELARRLNAMLAEPGGEATVCLVAIRASSARASGVSLRNGGTGTSSSRKGVSSSQGKEREGLPKQSGLSGWFWRTPERCGSMEHQYRKKGSLPRTNSRQASAMRTSSRPNSPAGMPHENGNWRSGA